MTRPLENLNAAARREADRLDAIANRIPVLSPITTRIRQPDEMLAAMHRQREPWSPEQWRFAEMMEARDA